MLQGLGILIAIGFLLGPFCSEAVAESSNDATKAFTVCKKQVYASVGGEDLQMDIYLPLQSAERVPCVIVIRGGGFKARNRESSNPFAEYLAEHGFAAAMIAYRGRPNHTYRETIADVKAAVRYIRANSKKHNIDPDRIGAVGSSAGGTLAALLAVTGGMEEFEGDSGRPEVSSRIQAAVTFAGVFDFVARFTDPRQIALQPKVERKKKTNGEWIGEAFSPTNTDWQAASPVNYIDKADPPMLLVHCKDDATVPWLQTKDMARRLMDAGVHTEVEYYKTGGHGFAGKEPRARLARMLEFFRRTLAQKTSPDASE